MCSLLRSSAGPSTKSRLHRRFLLTMLTMGGLFNEPTPSLKKAPIKPNCNSRAYPSLHLIRSESEHKVYLITNATANIEQWETEWLCECHSTSECWKILNGTTKLGVSVSPLPGFLDWNIWLALVTKMWAGMTVPVSVFRTD